MHAVGSESRSSHLSKSSTVISVNIRIANLITKKEGLCWTLLPELPRLNDRNESASRGMTGLRGKNSGETAIARNFAAQKVPFHVRAVLCASRKLVVWRETHFKRILSTAPASEGLSKRVLEYYSDVGVVIKKFRRVLLRGKIVLKNPVGCPFDLGVVL